MNSIELRVKNFSEIGRRSLNVLSGIPYEYLK